MSQPFHVVDAFTSEPLAGNPAAVYVLERWPSDRWLALVAREMNLAETAFVACTGAGYDLRWFTPAVEVDLCGHATLAAAHVLWETTVASRQTPIAFSTRSGLLTATRSGNEIALDFPLLHEREVPAPPGLAESLGITPLYIGQSRHDLLVQVASDEEVRAARPDFTRLKAIPVRGIILTADSALPEFDFVSRFSAPAAGIDEDPVTGSAHCCLVSFWQSRLGKSEFVAYQASSRGGIVKVRVEGERAILSGQAVTVSRGELLFGPN